MKRIVSLSLFAAAALALAGCGSSKSHPMPMAMVVLTPTTNQTARGTVHFMEQKDGSVEVQVDLQNVPPGIHGFHVHENPSCADDAKAAGGHFNPTAAPHAGPDAASHHAGDFGNVTADGAGNVKTTFTTRSITVHDGPASVMSRSVVLHAQADDLTTQPSGNSGGRIACGVVQGMAGGM